MKPCAIQFFVFLMVLAQWPLANAQEGKIKRANDNFEDYAFMDAIDTYEDLSEAGYNEEQIFMNLGNANYYNANYEEAAKWYEKLFTGDSSVIYNAYLYRYAQALKSLKRYEKSDLIMEKLGTRNRQDRRVGHFKANKGYLEAIALASGRYTIANAPFNSSASDFAAMFYKEGVVFASSRDTGVVIKNLHRWNNGSFLNLYKSTQGESVSKFSNKLNTKAHESTVTFTNDGKTLYFTRNNYDKGFSRDEDGVSRLKVYRAQWVDSTWTNIYELPFNSDDYSVAHPALNAANDKLYFASDMPGTLGASDIFVVDIHADGTYGDPVNLGPAINTEARETFPFASHDGILYFATDGHPGLGGLDVFAIQLSDLEAGVLNLGTPINGAKDDFAYVINTAGKGYFTSNREGGKGNDDIYSFVEDQPLTFPCTAILTGMTTNKENGQPLPNATVQLFGENGNVLDETISDTSGNFGFEYDCNAFKSLSLNAALADFEDASEKVMLESDSAPKEVNLPLVPKRKAAEIGTDLAKLLNLNPIYFDTNKSYIRPDAELELQKVLAYMNEYPKIKISVKSHTDSRGSDSYNLSLSDRRAKSTRAYLISKGISESRLTAKGYGETQLVNSCSNGVSCSKAEHSVNRRSEFIVVE